MIETVLVNGASGVLGSQIALQTAVSGFDVIVYGRSDGSIDRAKQKMESYIPRYEGESAVDYDEEDVQKAYDEKITFTTDIEESAKKADLIIEAILEKEEAKEDFFKQLSEIDVPEETIFATNTSSLRPSDFMEATGRKDRFLAMHFQNEIWSRNIVEIMPTEETNEETVETIKKFAENIDMEYVVLQKEHPGYLGNSLLMPFQKTGMLLWGSRKGTPHEIDRAVMKATDSEVGPFTVIDIVGFGTPSSMLETSLESGYGEDEVNKAVAYVVHFMQDMISMGRGGKLEGEGFYHYNKDEKPEFLQDDFLEDTPDVDLSDYGSSVEDKDKQQTIDLFTALLTAIFKGALELYAEGIAEPEDIDHVWKVATVEPWGAFELIEKIGAENVYPVIKESYEEDGTAEEELQQKVLQVLKEDDIN